MHKKFLFWQLWSCQLPGNNLYRMEAALPEPDEALMYFPYLYVHGKLFFIAHKIKFPLQYKRNYKNYKNGFTKGLIMAFIERASLSI